MALEYITVATTRPETMLGRYHVAVSPQDPERLILLERPLFCPLLIERFQFSLTGYVDGLLALVLLCNSSS